MTTRSWRSSWLVACLAAPSLGFAQDLEPRRWTHLPVGTDVFGFGYAYTTGDLSFDPVLRIENADVEMNTAVFSYTRYFGLGDRTARIDALVPVQSGKWDGIVDGAPRSVSRDGLADPTVRLSINIIGEPALTGAEFLAFRKENVATTSVGAALFLRLPLGEYDEDKLINLGQNRFVLGSQLGVLRTAGEWSYELTGTAFFFEDNDEFFGGHEREQDPLFATQAHVVKTFGQAWWVSAGVAYSWAGESTIDDVPKCDDRSSLFWGGSFGFRIGEAQGVRLAYARNDTLNDVGEDTDSFYVGWSIRF